MNNYRADIDGLRAVAVLSVVLFHINAAWLPGGFIGVDIFFVISGYLITKNILTENERGVFTLSGFYRRRIKRILPALSTVIIVTLIVAQFIFLPEDLERLSYSAIASQMSVANIYFTYFLDTSYFASNASLEPLLHIWSLGVEEQFYLFWPLIIVASINRFRSRSVVIVVLLITVLSFILGELLLDSYAKFSYYMLPSRVGELLIGALVYFASKSQLRYFDNRIVAESISLIGITLIGVSLFLLNENSGFPGFAAFPASFGTGLLIFSNGLRPTLIARYLSWRPIVAVGLVSYSLYLWHWPVLTFAKYLYGNDLSVKHTIIAVVIMTLLTLLSYLIIEKPARQSNKRFSQLLVRQFVVPTVGIIAISIGFISTNGLGFYQMSDEYQTSLAKSKAVPLHAGRFKYVCSENSKGDDQFAIPECIINAIKEPNVLLWGDSTARHYVGMVGELASKYKFSFRNVSQSSCPPILSGIEQYTNKTHRQGCLDMLPQVFDNLDNYNVIILGGLWSTYMSRGDRFSNKLTEAVKLFIDKGKIVIILGQAPSFSSYDRKCEQKSIKLPWLSCENRFTVPRELSETTNFKIRDIVNQFNDAYYFEPHQILCDHEVCRPYVDNKLAYFDSNHFSMNGSILIGKKFRNIENISPLFKKIAALSPNKDMTSSINLPWNEMEKKNQLLSRVDEFVHLSGTEDIMSADRWHGDGIVSIINGSDLFVIDGDDDELSKIYTGIDIPKFRSSNYSPTETHLLVNIKLLTKSLDFVLIRLKIRGNKKDYHVTVNPASQTYFSRIDMDSKNVDVSFNKERANVSMIIPLEKGVDKYSLVIYPSIGKLRDKYYENAIGKVLIEDMTIKTLSSKSND